MELIKEKWTIGHKSEFIKYLNSFSKGEVASSFEKKILNTNYPCIAVSSKHVDEIVKNIYKGNFLSFIDLWICDNHTALIITGKLIARIKDFELFTKYLYKYLDLVDGWAGCDSLKLQVKKEQRGRFFKLSQDLVKSDKTYYRRFGFIILFKLIDEEYIDRILEICQEQNGEKEYYVNMAISWLLCDCFIKFRDKTLKLLQKKCLNSFVQNKAISKCRDSFRVNYLDKELLKNYRIK